MRDSYDDPPEPTPERRGYRASDEKPAKYSPRQQATVPARATEPARPPPPLSRRGAGAPALRGPRHRGLLGAAPRNPEPKPVVAEPARPSRTENEDLLSPPPPAKKEPPPRIAEPPRPTLPPEPKKDISDWDPNGD
ncbi:hypothetical protein [Corallococcus sp. 4LFB]|uniref:hypothetical protein n=1 Tax=Corallococcus sp. 4LFB TaxID=3383249 RepID=UPI003976431C